MTGTPEQQLQAFLRAVTYETAAHDLVSAFSDVELQMLERSGQ